MNDRIKELIDHHERINNLYIIGPVQRAEVEDFVEAIVKECLKQIDLTRDALEAEGENDQALGADWAAMAVLRHFGIE